MKGPEIGPTVAGLGDVATVPGPPIHAKERSSMPRWLLILSSCFALAVACDRADREIFPFQPAKTSSASGSQNTFDGAGGGGEGGVGGQGGAGGQGGLGGGSFCDGPDVTCQECAQCLLGTDCSL